MPGAPWRRRKGRKAGRKPPACLIQLATPPACSWERWAQGWGVEGRVGPAQTSLVRRSRAVVCHIECQGMTRSNNQAGGQPQPFPDTGDSRCCQLISPLSGKDSVFPLPAHTFLLGGRKCSWQCSRQCCPCLSMSPCPLPRWAGTVPGPGNRGARSAFLWGCLPLLLPACPGHRPCPSGGGRAWAAACPPLASL